MSPDDEEFVDAESEPDEELRVYTHQEEPEAEPLPLPSRPKPPRQLSNLTSAKSFVTASSHPVADAEGTTAGTVETDGQTDPPEEQEASSARAPTQQESEARALGKRPLSTVDSTNGDPPSPLTGRSTDANSTTSLLRNADRCKAPSAAGPMSPTDVKFTRMRGPDPESESSETPGFTARVNTTLSRRKSNLRNLVKFDIPEDSKRATVHLRAKQAQMTVQRASTKLRKKRIEDGLVVKMERMLVRVDSAGKEVPDDFDENASQKIDSRVKDKWREYMVVCRHSTSDNADFVLQMYKTRVSLVREPFVAILTQRKGHPGD
jgi:hypothetical protein